MQHKMNKRINYNKIQKNMLNLFQTNTKRFFYLKYVYLNTFQKINELEKNLQELIVDMKNVKEENQLYASKEASLK